MSVLYWLIRIRNLFFWLIKIRKPGGMLIYIPIRKFISEFLFFSGVWIRESNLFFTRDLIIKMFYPLVWSGVSNLFLVRDRKLIS